MQTFLKDIGRHAPSSPKLMSQTGPKMLEFILSGAFNYITNLCSRILLTKLEIQMVTNNSKNNPCRTFVWLKALQNGTHQLNTRLQTMNDNYAKAKSDKYCLDKEEYINRINDLYLVIPNEDGQYSRY